MGPQDHHKSQAQQCVAVNPAHGFRDVERSELRKIESGEMAFPWKAHTNQLSNTKFSISNTNTHKNYFSDWPVALLYLVICI